MSGWLGFRKGEGAGRARDGAFLYPMLFVRVTVMTQATIQPPQDKLFEITWESPTTQAQRNGSRAGSRERRLRTSIIWIGGRGEKERKKKDEGRVQPPSSITWFTEDAIACDISSMPLIQIVQILFVRHSKPQLPKGPQPPSFILARVKYIELTPPPSQKPSSSRFPLRDPLN